MTHFIQSGRMRPATIILLLTVFLAAGVSGAAGAAEPISEHVWLLSTRRAPLCGSRRVAKAKPAYWRLGENHQWQREDQEAFLADGVRAVPTIFFVHGNRTGRQSAIREGDDLLRCLRQSAKGRPFRFVIWSWPSDRIQGRNRDDAREKAWRSDVQSYYLARLLASMDPETPVSTIGYSFGARVITGALELLAGGAIAGRQLPEPAEPRHGLRAVLIAAAVDSHWILPGRRNGLALDQLDQMLITRNGCDPVLKWYPLMYHIHGPRALGFSGPACPSWLGPSREKIELVGVSRQVGKNHAWDAYIRAPALRQRLGWYAFLEGPH